MSGAPTRPRLAIVTDAIAPYHQGGKEARYRELAPRLAAHADVHVYTMKWWDGPRTRRQDGVTYHALCPHLALYKGRRRSVLQAVVFALACLRLLFARFDAIEADHMPYLQLFPLKLVALLRRRKLAVTWHECWGPDYWREYLGAPGRVGWWFERATMQMSDAIIAASAETGSSLRAQLGERVPVVVAPNGVDVHAIRAARPDAHPRDILAVGRLIEHKRIDMLLDAVAVLAADGRDVTCRIVGDGPEAGALATQARQLGVADRVEFRRDVEGSEELFGLLQAARVFAFPSEREGFGIAALEAIAAGLPVVTTSAPDNLARHLVARSASGRVCAPEAVSLAHAIASALDAGQAPEADEWVGDYDWELVTRRVAGAVLA